MAATIRSRSTPSWSPRPSSSRARTRSRRARRPAEPPPRRSPTPRWRWNESPREDPQRGAPPWSASAKIAHQIGTRRSARSRRTRPTRSAAPRRHPRRSAPAGRTARRRPSRRPAERLTGRLRRIVGVVDRHLAVDRRVEGGAERDDSEGRCEGDEDDDADGESLLVRLEPSETGARAIEEATDESGERSEREGIRG